MFRTWSADLPADVEVCAVEYPGRGNRLREQPLHRLLPLAEAASRAIAAQAAVPFAVYGHSLGALVAFEAVRCLRRRGAPGPLQLSVSGRRPPHVPDPAPPLHALPEAEFVEAVRRRYDGIPEVVLREPDLMRLMLPAMRADFEVLESYEYTEEAPLDIPVSVFGGEQDPGLPATELAGWERETTGRCTIATWPGNHFFIQSARASFLSALGREAERLAAPAIAGVQA